MSPGFRRSGAGVSTDLGRGADSSCQCGVSPGVTGCGEHVGMARPRSANATWIWVIGRASTVTGRSRRERGCKPRLRYLRRCRSCRVADLGRCQVGSRSGHSSPVVYNVVAPPSALEELGGPRGPHPGHGLDEGRVRVVAEDLGDASVAMASLPRQIRASAATSPIRSAATVSPGTMTCWRWAWSTTSSRRRATSSRNSASASVAQ